MPFGLEGLGAIGGGIVGQIAANKNRNRARSQFEAMTDDAAALRDKYSGAYDSVKTPSFSTLDPNTDFVSKTGAVNQPSVTNADLTGARAQQGEGAGNMSDAAAGLKNFAAGGITPAEQAAMAKVRRDAGVQQRGSRNAALSRLASRGLGNSAASVFADAGAADNAMATEAQAGLDTQAQIFNRSLGATQALGSLGGQQSAAGVNLGQLNLADNAQTVGQNQFNSAQKLEQAKALDALQQWKIQNNQQNKVYNNTTQQQNFGNTMGLTNAQVSNASGLLQNLNNNRNALANNYLGRAQQDQQFYTGLGVAGGNVLGGIAGAAAGAAGGPAAAALPKKDEE
jgi:hypothetical protein